MTINEAMKKYRLPNPTTTEDLEMRFSGMDGKTLTFGDKVLSLPDTTTTGETSPAASARHTSSLPMTTPAKV